MVANYDWEFQTEAEALEEQIAITTMYRDVCHGGSAQWHKFNSQIENMERRLVLERERELVLIDRRTCPATGPQRDYCDNRLRFIDAQLDGVYEEWAARQ